MLPIVGTGIEATAARNTGQLILAEDNGEVTKPPLMKLLLSIKMAM